MNVHVENLLKLQALDFATAPAASTTDAAAALRAQIPPQILGHYSRLLARGKKGVAVVRHQVCTACHMHVPRAVELVLMRGDDIQLCETCGRYLYLSEDTAPPVAAALPTAKIKKAPRKRETLLQVA